MATSSDLQPKQSTPPGSPQDAEWRILAEEAAQENNPQKLIEVVEALTHALDQQHKKKQSAHLTVALNIHDWMGDFSVSDFQSSSRKLVWVKGSLKVEARSFWVAA